MREKIETKNPTNPQMIKWKLSIHKIKIDFESEYVINQLKKKKPIGYRIGKQ